VSQLPPFVDWVASATAAADFIVVYLEEAHPTDGWLYPQVQHFIKQHTTPAERAQAAKILDTKMGSLVGHTAQRIPVFTDSMSNEASLQFGALPERLAILLDGQVMFIGGKGPEDYSIAEASAALQKLK
jgi:hypothetical protein